MFSFGLKTVDLNFQPQRSSVIRINRAAVRKRISLKNFSYIVFSLSLLLSTQTLPINLLRSFIFDVSSAAVTFFDQPFKVLSHSLFHAHNLFQTQEKLYQEIERLRQQNTHLLKWKELAQKLHLDNTQLRSSAHFIEENPWPSVTVPVMSFQPFEQGQYLLVEGGSAAGLTKDQPVLTQQGLIGRISEVGQRTARVLLLTDINSRVPVTIAGTDGQAILAGNNTQMLEVTRLAQQTLVKVGDRLLTSGQGGIFPAGIAVAEITSVTEERITARPFASVNVPFVTVLQLDLFS